MDRARVRAHIHYQIKLPISCYRHHGTDGSNRMPYKRTILSEQEEKLGKV